MAIADISVLMQESSVRRDTQDFSPRFQGKTLDSGVGRSTRPRTAQVCRPTAQDRRRNRSHNVSHRSVYTHFQEPARASSLNPHPAPASATDPEGAVVDEATGGDAEARLW